MADSPKMFVNYKSLNHVMILSGNCEEWNIVSDLEHELSPFCPTLCEDIRILCHSLRVRFVFSMMY
jgi:hypothetical protein